MKILKALESAGKARREYSPQGYFVYLDDDNEFHENRGDNQGGFVYCNIDLLDDNWIPCPEEKEIRPKNSGETWEYLPKAEKMFTFTTSGLGLSVINEQGRTGSPKEIVHGKSGWIRVDPPVKSDTVENNNHMRMITDDEINVICDVLRESIQFYSIHGSHANSIVLHEIAKVLAEITKDAI